MAATSMHDYREATGEWPSWCRVSGREVRYFGTQPTTEPSDRLYVNTPKCWVERKDLVDV